MNKNTQVGLIIIIVSLVASVYFLKDSVFFYAKSPEARQEYQAKDPAIIKRIFNLGLDLQGGMRMVLEIDKSQLDKDAQKDVIDRAYTIIENRINGLGVAEPTIQKQAPDKIIVELPGLKDPANAKSVIGSTAQLEFMLLREPAELSRAITIVENTLKGKVDSTMIADSSDSASVKAKEGAEQAAQLFGGQDSSKTTAKDTSAAAIAASVAKITTTPASFTALLVQVGEQVGVLEINKSKVNEIFARTDVRAALDRAGLGGNVFLWGHSSEGGANGSPNKYRILYYVKARPEMKGDGIEDARASINQGGMATGQAIVELEMNRKGARTFARVTGANINKFLAIVLDSTVYSAPVIRGKIGGGRAQIEGRFSLEEAKSLAVVLRAGALPAPVKIIEESTVGPSLGQDSIIKAEWALIIAFVLIVMFMVFYYRLSGVIASFALFFHTLLLFAVMAGINAAITLPGIAGIILNYAMAVDANVIIFERIREELDSGKTVRSAIDAGFKRAFFTIFDSNMTTLITALLLFGFGTGALKGFAVTLTFGIIISMFTSLYVTQQIFHLLTDNSKNTKLSI